MHYIRNANAGDSGSRVPGVYFPVSQSEAFGGGREAVGEQLGEARPEGCVVVAARRRRGWAQPVWEPRARAAGVCGVPGFSSGWGGPGGRVFVSGAALGGGGGAPSVPQWPPGAGGS